MVEMSNIESIQNEVLRQLIVNEMTHLNKRLLLAESLNNFSIDQILACDIEKRITACNTTCADTWGTSAAEVIGQPMENAFPKMYECDAFKTGILNALKGYKSFVPSNKCLYSSHYEHHFIPLTEDSEVNGVLIIIHDVAHRIKAENELKRLNKELTLKNKILQQQNAEILSFSHVTGHDLKEPLRKIYLFLEMILKEEEQHLSKKSKSYLKRVQSSAQRMGLLTDDILALSKLNEQNAIEKVSLNDVLKIAITSLQEQISSKNAVITTTDLPAIQGYRSMLFQLFQNILSNALKFQHAGTAPVISITTSHQKGDSIKHNDAINDHNYLAISFTDNGIGFDMQYADKIFQMFQRLYDQSLYKGTGMGLTLCKKIIELHHGFITVDSHINHGSTFTCYFPEEVS